MNSHLSIVVPIHTIPAGGAHSPLALWSRDIPGKCELILALDVNTEDSSLRQWCEKFVPSPKKIIQRRNGNPGETRNMGVELATSEWIAFVDYDDFFDPRGALRIINELGTFSDLIVCRYQTFDRNNNLIGESQKLTNLGELTFDLGFWRCLYRRVFATLATFPPTRMAEDQVYFSRFLSLNPRINFSPEMIYSYVLGGDQQLTRRNDAKMELKKAILIIKEELSRSEVQIKYRRLILLRQYISIWKISGLLDKLRYFFEFLILVMKPSYINLVIELFLLLVRNRLCSLKVN